MTRTNLRRRLSTYSFWLWQARRVSSELNVALAEGPCTKSLSSLDRGTGAVGRVDRSVAAENIQVHGGIGFTWEHPAHLYFRRAKCSQMLFGNATFHRQRLLKELGL